VQHSNGLRHSVLHKAMWRREFVAHSQPIIALSGGRCVGTEALARWRQGKKLLSPDLFIPFAESAGMIQQITDRVLDIVVTETPTASLPPRLLRLLPAGAVAGWDLHPLESATFSRRIPATDSQPSHHG
jgi:predicted signal transduction protein with EAL and GGDEF domain